VQFVFAVTNQGTSRSYPFPLKRDAPACTPVTDIRCQLSPTRTFSLLLADGPLMSGCADETFCVFDTSHGNSDQWALLLYGLQSDEALSRRAPLDSITQRCREQEQLFRWRLRQTDAEQTIFLVMLEQQHDELQERLKQEELLLDREIVGVREELRLTERAKQEMVAVTAR
jgi:hypothetical protein